MANQENGKKISFSVSDDFNKQIEDYSERKDVAVSTFVKEAVEDKIQWC